ncbi:MAG: MaoC family dehydratase [Chloroflexi bacterium]|nr:MaoC family dehydratase [Chloroflexota bacterium]
MADLVQPAKLEDIPGGLKQTTKRTVAAEDNVAFCKLSGNDSPLLVDPGWAESSRLGGPVQSGVLTLAMAMAPLTQMEREVAGFRSALVALSARFRRPVKAGDTLTFESEGWEKIPERNRIRSKLIVKNGQGEVVMEAEVIDQLI